MAASGIMPYIGSTYSDLLGRDYVPGSSKNWRSVSDSTKENVFNLAAKEYEFDKNVEMWNMQNDYNSPAAQMERLQAAGLNPNLMYSMGTSGNASGSVQYSAPTMHGKDKSERVQRAAQSISAASQILGVLDQAATTAAKWTDLQTELPVRRFRNDVSTLQSDLVKYMFGNGITEEQLGAYDMDIGRLATDLVFGSNFANIAGTDLKNEQAQGERFARRINTYMTSPEYQKGQRDYYKYRGMSQGHQEYLLNIERQNQEAWQQMFGLNQKSITGATGSITQIIGMCLNFLKMFTR